MAKGRARQRRTDRRAARAQRTADRRQHRLDKKKERTERTRLRQEAKKSKFESKTAVAEAQAEADKVAYENGVQPIDRSGKGWDFAEGVVETVGSVFGAPSGNTVDDLVFEDVQPYNEPSAGGNNMLLLLGAGAVALYLFSQKKSK